MYVVLKITNNIKMEWMADFGKEMFNTHLGTNICWVYAIWVWHYVECFTYVI